MTGRIICVGDVMVDVLAVLPGPLVIGSDTPAPISFRHGGSAANTAAWLAEIGVPTAFVGRVGDDPFGRDVTNALLASGVATHVTVDRQTPTGTCLVLVSADGERTMVPSAGANATMSRTDLPATLVKSEDRLHVSGYVLFKAGTRPAAQAALEAASSVGAQISIDTASAEPIRAIGGERFLDWLPATALLIANADEALVLTGCAEPETAVALLARRFATVVVKMGERGAVAASGDGVQIVRTEPVAVVDSTGAGDAFAAGLLAALQTGSRLVDAVGQGNALGAQAVGVIGARPRPSVT
jgi:ribokinase